LRFACLKHNHQRGTQSFGTRAHDIHLAKLYGHQLKVVIASRMPTTAQTASHLIERQARKRIRS